MEKTEFIPLWQLRGREKTDRLLFPWKRLLARILDMCFYLLVWWTAGYLVFRWNLMLYPWIPRTLLIILISVAVMLVLEPPILSLLKTTPGKAVFGIRVTKPDGSRLSVKEAYIRVFRMARLGAGYIVPPGYNFVRMYMSMKKCEVEGRTEWDEGLSYTARGSFLAQVGLAIMYLLVIAILMSAGYFGADMPVHRGDLTAQELQENVDAYWKFHGTAWNTELFYTVNLQFYKRSAGHIFDRMEPPDVTVEEENGVVTAVSFEFNDATRLVSDALPVWLRCYTISFIGAQDGMNFISMHAPGGPLEQLLGPVDRLIAERRGTIEVNFISGGVEVNLEFTIDQMASARFSLRKI